MTDEPERDAYAGSVFDGFHLKPSPAPHELRNFLTADKDLFETIHMGAPCIDIDKWVLAIDGMVRNPIRLTLEQLKRLPSKQVTAFHECYGSPLKLASSGVHRIGNVTWTGVSLAALLDLAGINESAQYLWSEGLDRGSYGGQVIDRYQKDLPIEKARSPEVLLAYAMNGEPLSVNRGGPVRLVVPGYFGTNSTKWLCKLSAQPTRAQSPFTTTWYNNEIVEKDGSIVSVPVWGVTPHSIITSPADMSAIPAGTTEIDGWAWAEAPVARLEISVDDGMSWIEARLEPRAQFEWQSFHAVLTLPPGIVRLASRATDATGIAQPLTNSRNEVNRISVSVQCRQAK